MFYLQNLYRFFQGASPPAPMSAMVGDAGTSGMMAMPLKR
jgi:hypothetical protein